VQNILQSLKCFRFCKFRYVMILKVKIFQSLTLLMRLLQL